MTYAIVIETRNGIYLKGFTDTVIPEGMPWEGYTVELTEVNNLFITIPPETDYFNTHD